MSGIINSASNIGSKSGVIDNFTVIGEPTFSATSYLRGGLKTWEVAFSTTANTSYTLADFTVPWHGAFRLEAVIANSQYISYAMAYYIIGTHRYTDASTGTGYWGTALGSVTSAQAGDLELEKTTDTNFQVRKTAGLLTNAVNGFIKFTSTIT